MRRTALSILICALTTGAFATDFRLNIDAPSEAVSHAKVIRLFGPKMAKGDHIVAISSGKGQGTPVQVVLDTKSGAGTLLGEIKGSGFTGKLVQASGDAPNRTLSGTLTKIVPGASDEPGLFASIASFFTSTVGFITLGALAILGAVFFLFRSRPRGEGPALPNRRKAIDESLKDIQRRLEKIDENQHMLVKKPPMLRSFSKQIQEFDTRLGALESSLRSVQSIVADTSKNLGAVEKGQTDMRSKVDSNESLLKELGEALAAARSSLEALDGDMQTVGKQADAKGDELLSKLAKLSLEVQSRLSGLEKSSEAAAGALSKAAKQDALEQVASELRELKKKEIDFGPLQSKFDARFSELLTKEEFEPVQTDLQELQGFVGWLRDEQRGLVQQVAELPKKEVDLAPIHSEVAKLQDQVAELAAREVDLGPVSDQVAKVEAALAELSGKEVDFSPLTEDLSTLRKQVEELTAREVDLSPVHDRLSQLETLVQALPTEAADLAPVQVRMDDLGERLAGLSKSVEALQKQTIDWAPVLEQLDGLRPADYSALFNDLSAGNTEVKKQVDALSAELSAMKSRLDQPDETLKSLSAGQKALAGEVSKLQQSVAEIGSRTDQREALLLSLQSRVAESESGQAAGAELLPVVADLRLELQALATEQGKAMQSLEAVTSMVSELQAVEPAPAFDSGNLELELKRLSATVDELRAQPVAAPATQSEVDLSGFESELRKLSEAVEEVRAHAASVPPVSISSQEAAEIDWSPVHSELKRLSDTVSALQGGGSETVAFDSSGLESEMRALAASVQELRTRPTEAPAAVDLSPLEDRLQALSSAFQAWSSNQPDYQAQLEALRADLEKQQGLSSEERKRLEAELEAVRASAAHAESVAAAAAERAVEENPKSERSQKQPAAEAKPKPQAVSETSEEDRKPAAKSDVSLQVSQDAQEDAEGEDDADVSGWTLPGGSRSRRWSTKVSAAPAVHASEKALTPLTPTVTPDSEFQVGAMLYVGKKVLYGHGTSLRSTWPGKSPSSASLQEALPADPWRLAFLDGHVFCVEDGQVEIVSVASWHVVARFSGDFVDHTSTETHWVGLGSALGRLYLDFRNLQGRLLGEPVQLPIDSENGVGLVADHERIFVGSRDGRIFKVELGKVSEFASLKSEGLELKSLSTVKSGILAVFTDGKKDQVRVFSFAGKALKELSLDFAGNGLNPVLMGDRAYFVDSANSQVVAVDYARGEVAATLPLPGSFVRQVSGLYSKDKQALLLTAGQDAGSAKVILMDAETGATSVVCDAKEMRVDAIVADGRIVVSSSNSYQNSLRVFDPFGQESQRKAA